MKWEYKGVPLLHPVTIARRLIFWPFVQVMKWTLLILIFLGWGKDEAETWWRDMK